MKSIDIGDKIRCSYIESLQMNHALSREARVDLHPGEGMKVNGESFFVLGGELRNSTAGFAEKMQSLWRNAADFGLNTIILPVCWEDIEPEEGKYDFSLITSHIESARKHGLRLIVLWFASWKNATSSYAPEWVKRDLVRFPRLQIKQGVSANAVSCFSKNALDADSRAFAALMKRISEIDSCARTVIMAQVENEVGILGARRDYSPLAEAQFNSPVPDALLRHLQEHEETLHPQIARSVSRIVNGRELAWKDIFAEDADEIFMAWHFASYLEKVASAGKKENNIPIYANAWLPNPGRDKAGQYPSGGPVPKVLDVWRAAAPSIDFYSPDIYRKDFRTVCEEYASNGNPLFVPEAKWDNGASSTALYLAGHQQSIGFSPFAIDDILHTEHPLSTVYKFLAAMDKKLADAKRKGEICSFYQQDEDEKLVLKLGDFSAIVRTKKIQDGGSIPSAGIIIAEGNCEFTVAAINATIEFSSSPGFESNIEFISADELSFEDGEEKILGRLNGDETYHGKTLIFDSKPRIIRVKLNENSFPLMHQSGWEFPG